MCFLFCAQHHFNFAKKLMNHKIKFKLLRPLKSKNRNQEINVVQSDYSIIFVKHCAMKVRSVIAYKNYFFDFLTHQRPKVKEKIYWTIKVFEELKVIRIEYENEK